MALLKIKSGLLMAMKKAITTIAVPIKLKAVSRFPQLLLLTTASGGSAVSANPAAVPCSSRRPKLRSLRSLERSKSVA